MKGHGAILTTDRQAIRKIKSECPDDLRLAELERAIRHAANALLDLQHPDGYWCFELEADCTIPAEYILMMHYMDELDSQLESKIASYLRARQGEDGGWPLYYGGNAEISCSVKAYYALKLAGDDDMTVLALHVDVLWQAVDDFAIRVQRGACCCRPCAVARSSISNM